MVVIGDCTLYHGDSIEILPTLGPCADLVVTDPPYMLTSGGCAPKNGARMSGKFASDVYNNGGEIVTCNVDWPDFMPLIYKAMRGNSHAYVMCNCRHVRGLLNAAHDAGLRYHNLLIWDKGNATPSHSYMRNTEFAGFFFKGAEKYINDCGAKQLLYIPQEPYGDHPTPKPVMLMRHYIEQSSKPDETVLDPFMGAGATAIAAIKSGRKFIGIEIEQKWFDVTCKRVSDYYESAKQGDMFA